MTTITAQPRRNTDPPRQAGAFTLVEVLIALSVTTIVFAALFSSWGFIGHGTLVMGHYIEMNSTGRLGLEHFARDVRRARGLDRGFGPDSMVLVMETDENGVLHKVAYYHNPSARTFVRQTGTRASGANTDNWGDAEIIFDQVEDMELSYFKTTGEAPINGLEARLIQLELRMSRSMRNRDATKKIVSARYIMRNKQHGEIWRDNDDT